ncbi:reverse transcriptase domain-containing protein, partial [Tanacetum coccineum]
MESPSVRPNDYLFSTFIDHHATSKNAWYDRLPRNSIHSFDEMMRKFLSKYFPPSMVTKLRNEITKFRQEPHESLFEAWERYKLYIDRCPNHNMLLVTQIDTFYNGLTLRHRDTINAAAGGTFMQKTPEECYELIENMTAHHNHWDTSATRDETSRTISSTTTTESPEVVRQLEMMNKNFLDMMRQIQSVKSVSPKCETCGGPHSFTECPAVDGYTQEAAYATTELWNEFKSSLDARTNKIENQNNQIMNMITNLTMQKQNSSGSGSLSSNTVANPRGDVKAITTQSDVYYDGPSIPPTPSLLPKEVKRETEATKDKVQTTSLQSTAHVQPPVVQIPILEPEVAPKPNPKPSIPYPLRLNDQKLREKANDQMLKFLQIFQKLHFDISFTDALLHMPKFASTFKRLDECLALVDLGAIINLMPLSVWKKLSLPELTLTRMTLELSDRSVAHPKSVFEDVFVKVGKFYFPADFVVVDYDVDPWVPLILGRPFLRTARALSDVHGEELTLRVNDEAITFKVGHTSRYSCNYYNEMVYHVNVIDIACEEYAQEVLGFLDSLTSGNPTPSDPIIASSSPSFTPFEGDILYLEKLLNEDPSPSLPLMKNDDLKQVDVTKMKPSIEEPPELELKDLPSRLEYAFLEGTDKLPVIISKELKDEENAALLKVLKSHKRAIAWKISDIKGKDPHFCTHKIIMEDDFKLEVQHQRRVNPKLHEVIKKEVIKLLDVGLIYPISDSPWVSPVHCVPKKGGMTVVENEDNELITTRLVTGWRVCIDYRKLNDATCKDHFPLPFMDQMLERLAGNEYYCFLDGFSGYFQIPIDPQDQEKTTFTCPYRTIEVDRAKVDVIAKLPHPTSVKGVRSFLGHVGFYRRFIQDFSKIARPMTHLLEKETPFIFSKECIKAFNILKKKLTEAPILVSPDWDL